MKVTILIEAQYLY